MDTMRDPHVVALCYRLATNQEVEFSNPSPRDWEVEEFRLRLEAGQARVEMKKHYASADEAKRHVEPFLRSWELDTALREGRSEIRFEYVRPEIVDRNPPPPSPPGTPVRITATATMNTEATLVRRIIKRAYPTPPQAFVASPDVETMWYRYEGYQKGREPLGAMAYFCLTLLERKSGGRDDAATQYRINRQVLGKLGALTSAAGDERTARKFTEESRPHTPAEAAWIESAVRAIIRRVGEYAAAPGEQHPEITMADLPRLS